MILIAESGSTKCDWVLLDLKGREIDRWNTIGFNPYFHSKEMIVTTLKSTKEFKVWKERIEQVWFYGAGCSTTELKTIVKNGLDEFFVNSSNHIGHDLEAAAFALYEGEPLVVCILGTGSNSCMFDGNKITEETPSLAYVLGDEGSASFIGKKLVSDYLYKRLPKELSDDFTNVYGITKDCVTDAVYNKPHANVYLASFGPFAGKWTAHPYIKEVVKDGFDKFIDIHISCFPNMKQLPVSFVGSVAKIYEDTLTDCLHERGYKKGKVLAKPINSLIQYHLDVLDILSVVR